MTIEQIIDLITKNGLNIIEMDFEGNAKGHYADGTIVLSNKITTPRERMCVLAEEFGHYMTSAGSMLNQSFISNAKKERAARAYAFNEFLGIDRIIMAYEANCTNRYEVAEYLGVTEEFLDEALKYYHQKYAPFVTYDDYIIYFEPLTVVKKI